MTLKRSPSVASKNTTPSKRQKLGIQPPGLASKVAGLSDVIMKVDTIPEEARKMLCASLTVALGTPAPQRHQFHLQFIAYAKEVIGSFENSLKEEVAKAQELERCAGAEEALRQERLEAAETSFLAKSNAAAAISEALAKAKGTVNDLVSQHKQLESNRVKKDRELDLAASRKDDLQQAHGILQKLKETGEAAQEPDIKVLLKKAKDLKLEPTMINALPSSFRKAKTARHSFDDIVTASFETEVQKSYDSIKELLETAESAKAERLKDIEAVAATLQEAKAQEEASKNEQKLADEEQTAAEKEVASCQAAVKNYASDMKKVQKDIETKQKEVEKLESGVLKSLAELEEFDGLPRRSQYKVIGGVSYERDLLDIADVAAAEGQVVTQETAAKLYTAAMDGPGITKTEKRTLNYIMKQYSFEASAAEWLTTKMGNSLYQVIDGQRYERGLLQLVADAAKPIAQDSAQKLWESANDGFLVTSTEKATVEYIMGHYDFEETAKAWLSEQLSQGVVNNEE